ncbi:hypothetical protein [Nocardia africana]
MDYARLGLEYVNALKWPFVACYLATLFKVPMKEVIERLRFKSFSYPGGKAEFYEERLEALSAPAPGVETNSAGEGTLTAEVQAGTDATIKPPPARATAELSAPTVITSASGGRLVEAAESLQRRMSSNPITAMGMAQGMLLRLMESEFGIQWSHREAVNAHRLARAGMDADLAEDIAEVLALGDGMIKDYGAEVPPYMARHYVRTVATLLKRAAEEKERLTVHHISPN